MLRLTPKQYQELTRKMRAGGSPPKLPRLPAITAKATAHQKSEQTKDERLFSEYLEIQKRCGTVLWYEFEPIKLKLYVIEQIQASGDVKRTSGYYAPDYGVVWADGTFEFIEIKGTTRGKTKAGDVREMPYAKEDAILKLRLAAASYPFLFSLRHRSRTGEWLTIRLERIGDEVREISETLAAIAV